MLDNYLFNKIESSLRESSQKFSESFVEQTFNLLFSDTDKNLDQLQELQKWNFFLNFQKALTTRFFPKIPVCNPMPNTFLRYIYHKDQRKTSMKSKPLAYVSFKFDQIIGLNFTKKPINLKNLLIKIKVDNIEVVSNIIDNTNNETCLIDLNINLNPIAIYNLDCDIVINLYKVNFAFLAKNQIQEQILENYGGLIVPVKNLLLKLEKESDSDVLINQFNSRVKNYSKKILGLFKKKRRENLELFRSLGSYVKNSRYKNDVLNELAKYSINRNNGKKIVKPILSTHPIEVTLSGWFQLYPILNPSIESKYIMPLAGFPAIGMKNPKKSLGFMKLSIIMNLADRNYILSYNSNQSIIYNIWGMQFNLELYQMQYFGLEFHKLFFQIPDWYKAITLYTFLFNKKMHSNYLNKISKNLLRLYFILFWTLLSITTLYLRIYEIPFAMLLLILLISSIYWNNHTSFNYPRYKNYTHELMNDTANVTSKKPLFDDSNVISSKNHTINSIETFQNIVNLNNGKMKQNRGYSIDQMKQKTVDFLQECCEIPHFSSIFDLYGNQAKIFDSWINNNAVSLRVPNDIDFFQSMKKIFATKPSGKVDNMIEFRNQISSITKKLSRKLDSSDSVKKSQNDKNTIVESKIDQEKIKKISSISNNLPSLLIQQISSNKIRESYIASFLGRLDISYVEDTQIKPFFADDCDSTDIYYMKHLTLCTIETIQFFFVVVVNLINKISYSLNWTDPILTRLTIIILGLGTLDITIALYFFLKILPQAITRFIFILFPFIIINLLLDRNFIEDLDLQYVIIGWVEELYKWGYQSALIHRISIDIFDNLYMSDLISLSERNKKLQDLNNYITKLKTEKNDLIKSDINHKKKFNESTIERTKTTENLKDRKEISKNNEKKRNSEKKINFDLPLPNFLLGFESKTYHLHLYIIHILSLLYYYGTKYLKFRLKMVFYWFLRLPDNREIFHRRVCQSQWMGENIDKFISKDQDIVYFVNEQMRKCC